MDAARHSFNIPRFEKIMALARSRPHDGRDNVNERDNALAKARAMAEKAGMSFEDALGLLGTRPKATTWAEQFSEAMEREMAAAEARRRQAEAEAFRQRAEARSKPKPPPPEFDEQPMERAIREALMRNAIDPDALTARRQLKGIHLVLARAIPWPETLREMIVEVRAWDLIEDARCRTKPDYVLTGGPRIRRQMVVADLIVEPATSVADAMARVAWVRELSRDHVPERRRIDPGDVFWAVAADMEKIADALRQTREAGRASEASPKRSREAARAAVQRILQEPGGMSLSLRTVAERAGVSPQTVSNVKAKLDLSKLDKRGKKPAAEAEDKRKQPT